MDKEIYDVLDTLENNNFESYVIGGYVRDKLLGKAVKDIDIVTSAKSKDVIKLFKNYNIKVAESFGVVNMRKGSYTFDIATFRTESDYENNRPKETKYINDLYTDLLRRDFTINTLCMDKNGKLIDKLDAYQDLEHSIIYTVGDVNKKFKEDKTRILRAIRFMVTLNFKLSPDIISYIENNKEDLLQISYTKRKEELNKIFVSKNYLMFIEFIKKYDLEKYIGIYIKKVKKTNDIIGFWSQIEYDTNYPFTSVESKQIETIKSLVNKKTIDKIDIYNYGVYVCAIASKILSLNMNVNKIYNSLPIYTKKDIDISTEDILEHVNITNNKDIGLLYNDIEKNIINGKILNKKEEILRFLRGKI